MAQIYTPPENLLAVTPLEPNLTVDSNIPDTVTPLDVDLLKFKPELPPLDYTNLDFSSIKLQLLNLLRANAAKLGYSVRDFSDANSAGMMLNLMAYMGQMLSYHTDAMVNELFIDTAQSPASVNRLMSLFKYKPSRPKAGVLFFKVVRARSSASTSDARIAEDSAEIVLSSSLNRKQLSFGGETFELFPVKISTDGTFTPDYFGDVTIPAYKTSGIDDPDSDIFDRELNTYVCFGLTGTTQVEDFVSSGQSNQTITLSGGPVLDSDVIVQVQNTKATIPGKYIYETWTELPYLSLAGFPNVSKISATSNTATPYLIVPIKLGDALLNMKITNVLKTGTLVALDYNNQAIQVNYESFLDLQIPYRLGFVHSVTSDSYPDAVDYIDVVLYHPSYICSDDIYSYVYTSAGDKVYWSEGDILYVLKEATVISAYENDHLQPILISDTQLQLADSTVYPGIRYLKSNPDAKIAVGRVVSNNTIALGLSADISTSYIAQPVYELTTTGEFKCQVKFGNGVFGQIPERGAAIKIIYRTNTSNIYGYIVSSNEANQTLRYGNVALSLSNEYPSSPSTAGETPADSKFLAPKFFSSQDRAVTSADYITLAKRYNSSYKISAGLTKAEAEGSIIKLYALAKTSAYTFEPLTLVEKYGLVHHLNQYKMVGTDIEIGDGTVRGLSFLVDIKVQAGFLAGAVKQSVSTAIYEYFTSSFDLGDGFSSGELLKSIANISGIKAITIYMYTGDVLESADAYVPLQDIPSYSSYTNTSSISSNISPVRYNELLTLSNVTVNVVS